MKIILQLPTGKAVIKGHLRNISKQLSERQKTARGVQKDRKTV